MPNPRYFYCTLAIAVVIFIACLLMAGPMRPGLPVVTDMPTRLAYIQSHLALWQLGWLFWMAAALSLLLFCCLLASAIPPSPVRQFGLLLVALGIVPDVAAETLYAFVFPAMISAGSSVELLHFIDQLAMHLTGFLGNGLYNIGGLILTLLLLQHKPGLKLWIYPGILAWVAGLGLSVAIASQQLALAEALTAFSMALSTAWFVLIAYKLWIKADV
ncbi:MAG TPA: hypothetical protein VJ795_15015 [Rheinheimera sp.]|uniref:hypothetical protein n=1 Tax=Rheinheimera sp. TaxID=1869214 RepID=UPI002B4A8E02|nr:hypothetical protein [Rheinheimera sp.]HJS16384.1 hypothetical protein [Rheinheimera sp.]